ncbi:MAG: hypothetical protein KDI54_18810 [Gammaproteobacteria bacterium]|nr:hypothetical protein [Gammaproteobacteria bacterium]
MSSQGLTLELVESQGSYDSLLKVRDGQADAAFVQSGVTVEGEIFFLGSLY